MNKEIEFLRKVRSSINGKTLSDFVRKNYQVELQTDNGTVAFIISGKIDDNDFNLIAIKDNDVFFIDWDSDIYINGEEIDSTEKLELLEPIIKSNKER